jgi:hypothetical protein
MAQTATKPTQALTWILLFFAIVLLFLFQSLLGNLTSSYLANMLIVGVATLASQVVLAFGCGIAIGILRVYQKIRAQMRYPASPQLDLLRVEDMPLEIATAVEETASALSPLGFRLIGCVKVITIPGTAFYHGILRNPRAGSIARCAQFVQNDYSENVLVFQNRLADGTDYTTGHMSPAFFARAVQARPKGRSGLAFFDINDPARLARLHAAAVERYHSGPVDTGTLDPIRCQAETFGREMANQLEAGYLRREGDEYCTTRVGALKMALKIAWPGFAIRIRSARRRAQRFLEETDL